MRAPLSVPSLPWLRLELLTALCLAAVTGCAGRPVPAVLADVDAGSAPVTDAGWAPLLDAGHVALDGGRIDSDGGDKACDEATLGPIYDRIERILSDEHADSCNACHLGGLDLAAFAQPSACETMACLVDIGWADLDQPEESLIFEFISRAASPDGGVVDGGRAAGISAASVQAEHDAFRDWITFSSQCHEAMCGTLEAPCGVPEDGGQVDGGFEAPADGGVGAFDAGPIACGLPPRPDAGPACDFEAELQRFNDDVWVWKGRCSHCHAEDAALSVGNPPPWMAPPDDVDAAERTMCSVAARGYLDVDAPDQSLLLLKPLREQFGGVMHGGGSKFLSTGDAAYLGFRRYIEAWAACRLLPSVSTDDAGVSAIDGGDLDEPVDDAGASSWGNDGGAP